MTLAHPEVLWLLSALPLLWLLQSWHWWWQARRRAGVGMTSPGLLIRGSSWRSGLRSLMLWMGIVALVVAVARPRWGEAVMTQSEGGVTLAILLDCSYSMLAEDLYPNRIEHAHFKINDLLDLRPDARVALIPFAGISALRHPPSTDHRSVRRMVGELGPELFERRYQGTAIGLAVRRAVNTLSGGADGAQAIIIFSDGDDPDQDEVQRSATLAAAAGIPIYGIVMGDPELTATLRIGGREVPMTPGRATLDALSQATGGRTVYASTDSSDVSSILEHIAETLEESLWDQSLRGVQQERYQWPLALAVLFLSLWWGIPALGRRQLPLILLAMLPMAVPASEAPRSVWQQLDAASALLDEDAVAGEDALRRLVDAHPHFLAGHYNLGVILSERDGERAQEHLRRATAANDRTLAAAAWYHLALIEHRTGRHEEALAAATRAHELEPHHPIYDSGRQALQRHWLRLEEERRLAREAAAAQLRVLSRRLPAGRVGQPYGAQVQAAGGAGEPYIFNRAAVSEAEVAVLPSLSLSADGTLSGTPQPGEAGEHQLPVQLRDSEGAEVGASLRLQIRPALAMLSSELPLAVRNQPYLAQLEVAHAQRAQWEIEGLPAGLRSEGRGNTVTIRGVPSTAGQYILKVTVSDSDGAQLRTQVGLEVRDGFAPAEASLPDATRGHPYRGRLTVRGPDDLYQWASVGVVGLSVDRDGQVRGIPSQAGDHRLLVTLSNSAGLSDDFSIGITINEPPMLRLPERIDGVVGQLMREPLVTEHGTAPLTYTLGQGSLPSGVELSPEGVLLGAPQEEGEFPVILMISDRWQAETRARTTLVISGRPEDGDDESGEGDDGDDNDDGDASDEGESDNGDSGDGEAGDADEVGGDGDGSGESGEGRDLDGDDESADPLAGSDESDEGAGGDRADQPDPIDEGDSADQQPPRSLSEAEARRWLESVLDAERQGVRDSLQRLLRAGAEGEGSEEQPW